MNNYLENFASNLKKLRKFYSIKQEELSQKTGISRSNISNYESCKNEPTLTSLIKITGVFNINIDQLIKTELADDILTNNNIIGNKNKYISSLEVFANNLKQLRKDKNIYQVQLAKEVGIAKSNISVYEAGVSDPTLSSLTKLSEYFNVTITELVTQEIAPERFMESETEFFKKVSADIKIIETDEEFLKFLINLKSYYEKQSEKLKNIINIEIPSKLKEIDEIIEFINFKKNR